MKFHVLWLILALTVNSLCHAQTELDLTDIDKMAQEAGAPTSFNDAPKNPRTLPDTTFDQSKRITLREVVETGLRRNNFQKAREYEREKVELDWKDNHDSFWYPQLNLTLNTSDALVENLYTDVYSHNGTSKTPNGYLGLEFEDYSLFNWGKDYLDYQNNKQNYKISKNRLKWQRRWLRFSLISQYFNVAKAKRILQIKRIQLRNTSFIYRLAKEKLTLKKITGQHYLQAKAEFLRSHSEYQQALYDVTEQENLLAKHLGDRLTTSYTPAEQLKYVPLTTTKEESYNYALSLSPQYLEAHARLKNANRSYQKALKNNMPLPKFALKLGAFRHQLTGAGAYDNVGLSNGSRNVEVVAAVNMKWRIWGSGGFFNSRVQDRSYIEKRTAEIEFDEAKRNVSSYVNAYHRKIRYLEKQIEANSAFVKNARKTYDRTLDNYIAGKTTFPNIKMVLTSLILSETNYEISKYQHMVEKLKLAHLMGVNDFPGESFEKMVLK